MTNTYARSLLLILLGIITMSVLGQAQQQEAKRIKFKKGKTSASVKGYIGGESHDSYVLHVRKGQTMTLTIRYPRNHAEFTISRTEFGEPVDFGSESRNGKSWSGKIPETGDYYIAVVAHPDARYRLTVSVR